MMRDGGLKSRTDLFRGLKDEVRTDCRYKFLTTVIPNILPNLPLAYFLDGTCAEAWEKESTTSRFPFVGGLELSFIKGLSIFMLLCL
jgi:hypothetical protein